MTSPSPVELVANRLREGAPTRVAVVGAGASGRAAMDLLLDCGAQVLAVDDRDEALTSLPPNIEGMAFRSSAFVGQDLVVTSPGVSLAREELSEVQDRLVGEVELASWFVRTPLVGITGTNGKSTTTALLGHLLESSGRRVFVGGNFGRPLSELARDDKKRAAASADWAVVELSSYQLESTCRARFKIAIWLNLQPDHLDRHGTLEAYAAAKARLFDMVEPVTGWVLAAFDDPIVRSYAEAQPGPVRWFAVGTELGSRPGVQVFSANAVRDDEQYLVDTPSLLGPHNHQNAAAAIDSARLLGVSADQIRTGLSSFSGLPHRLALVQEAGGVRWYDDSKATNVASAKTAVLAMPGPVWLIAGGRDKGGDWGPLVEVSKGRVLRVFAIGEAMPKVVAAFEPYISVEEVTTLAAAVRRAREVSSPGQSVLLAPACSSFDQFENYMLRGREFARLVRETSQP